VTFKLFVEPALIAWSHGAPRQLTLSATATHALKRSPGRMEFLRARLFTQSGLLMAEALPGQGSHMLGTLRFTNGFIRVDAESEGFDRNETVTVIPLTLDIP
jgi:molybdopterin molybdotransferase